MDGDSSHPGTSISVNVLSKTMTVSDPLLQCPTIPRVYVHPILEGWDKISHRAVMPSRPTSCPTLTTPS